MSEQFSHVRCIFVVAVLLASSMLLPPLIVEGRERTPAVLYIEQQDLDGDGKPDVTFIDCEFIALYPANYFQGGVREEALVAVYDGDQDMKSAKNWSEATDFENDIWIFDVGKDGHAELIIVFGREKDQWIALLYDDRDGDEEVRYTVQNGAVRILESNFWTIKVVSDAPWGAPFKELKFFVDGYVLRGFGLKDVENTPAMRNLLVNNGSVDFEYRVVDNNADGIPDYEWMQRFTWLPYPHVESRNYLFVNLSKQQPQGYAEVIFWPLLVTSHGKGEVYRVFDYMPAVFFDWSHGRVWDVGVIGYPIEQGYLVNSAAELWSENDINYANFENPMAWYDLANDQDGYPELFIRLENYRPFDPLVFSGRYPLPLVRADYAWDQDNDGGWDYQISLAGKHAIDRVVWLKRLGLKTVPYVEIPYWVTGKTWDAGTFVVAEDNPRRGSEGMYSWTAGEGYMQGKRVYSPLFGRYITGMDDNPPIEVYQDIETGLRGEYSFNLSYSPYLYFSSVDKRLHLLWASGGLWRVNSQVEVAFANLNSDAYIDQWRYLENGEIRRQLNVAEGWLIYTNDSQVLLKRADIVPSLFETLPPRNHEEWLALGRQLEAHRRDFAPGDFEAMVAPFEGPESRIIGATLRDFRFTDTGFRFVLALAPGFRVATGEDWLGVRGLSPGEYVVTYDSSFRVEPLTPPKLHLEPVADPFVTEPEPTVFVPTEIAFMLWNEGLEDSGEVTITLTATSPHGETIKLGEMSAKVLSGEAVRLRFPWTPSEEGLWLIQARVENFHSASTTLQINVAKPEDLKFRDMISAFNIVPPFAVTGLLLSIGVAGSVFAALTLRTRIEPDHRV